MIPKNLLFVLMSLVSHCRIGANGDANDRGMIWNVSVATQLQLDQFMENVTAYNNRGSTSYFHLSLTGENNYELDIVKLMNISLTDGGCLILENKGGPTEIKCTTTQSNLEELRDFVQPISRAFLVLMDGLVITGCPVPLMMEEVFNVTIQNCVFQ